MGLFRRGQAQAEPEGSGDDGSSAPANDGPPTAASPTREAAWRSAPALPLAVQRNVATIDAPRFEADLASRHSPASLAPLVELIRRHVLDAARLHGDDTTVPVLAKGKTVTGRVWAYVRDDRPFAGPAPPAAVVV